MSSMGFALAGQSLIAEKPKSKKTVNINAIDSKISEHGGFGPSVHNPMASNFNQSSNPSKSPFKLLKDGDL